MVLPGAMDETLQNVWAMRQAAAHSQKPNFQLSKSYWTQGGDSIDILGMKLGTKLGAILGPLLGACPNIMRSFEPNFVPKMSIESPPCFR